MRFLDVLFNMHEIMGRLSFLFSTSCCILLQLVTVAQGVGINAEDHPPHPSAILDVSSTSQGMVPPRMTTEQRNAIVSPVNGLLIYNTDTNCLNIWNGQGWRQSCFDCDFNPPSVSNSGPVCVGGTVQLTASSIAGATFSWTGPGGFTSALQNPVLTNADILDSGDYSVVATANGCSASAQTTVVAVYPIPVITASASNDGVACAGSDVSLTVSTVSGASYAWTGPNGYSSAAQNPELINVQTSQSGAYSVVATAFGCSSQSASANVTVNAPPPAPGAISGSGFLCPNAANEIYSIASVTEADSYHWSVPSGAIISTNSGTGITVTFGPDPSGEISITAQNTCGTSAPSALEISLNPVCSPHIVNYTGDIQSFIVPAGVSQLNVKLWGAGGGGGREYPGWGTPLAGGAGGYSEATISVTPGETLDVIVGQAGWTTSSAVTYTFGGGAGPKSPVGGGVGGGRSAIRRDSDELITAGGGGGGSNSNLYVTDIGGNGGGLSGTGGGDLQNGSGGTQISGGAASQYNGAEPGTQFQGGRGSSEVGGGHCSSGGGGGWYGGGGGNIGLGGGGSGYISGQGVSNGSTITGSGISPPNTEDPIYLAPAGVGGNPGGTAGSGLVVIFW